MERSLRIFSDYWALRSESCGAFFDVWAITRYNYCGLKPQNF